MQFNVKILSTLIELQIHLLVADKAGYYPNMKNIIVYICIDNTAVYRSFGICLYMYFRTPDTRLTSY